MSQLRVLKTELAILEKQFPRNNGPFQIILAATEELVCRFVDTKGNKYNLQCNISVRKEGGREEGGRKEMLTCLSSPSQPNYPVVLPIWISECNDPFTIQLIEELNVSDEASSSASHPVSWLSPPLPPVSYRGCPSSPSAASKDSTLGHSNV